MIRRDLAPRLLRAAQTFPAITLTGARQSGKTALCRAAFPRHPYVNLDAPDQRAFAKDDPRGFLARVPDGAIVDEVHRVPDLPSYLQGVIDEDRVPGRWILTSSHDLGLLGTVRQSLAGRTAVFDIFPLSQSEIAGAGLSAASLEETLFAGGYPAIFDRDLDPADWLRFHVQDFLDREARSITNIADLVRFEEFVRQCAARTGQLVNHSLLARACGVSQPTAKAWLHVLETAFITFSLPSCRGVRGARLVRGSKLYFHDTGLLCWLMGVREPEHLRAHPLRGVIFETWVVSEMRRQWVNEWPVHRLSFYQDRSGIEVPLVIDQPSGVMLVGITSAATASSHRFDHARRAARHFEDSHRPSHFVVAYGGDERREHSIGRVIPWRRLHEACEPLLSPSVPDGHRF